MIISLGKGKIEKKRYRTFVLLVTLNTFQYFDETVVNRGSLSME